MFSKLYYISFSIFTTFNDILQYTVYNIHNKDGDGSGVFGKFRFVYAVLWPR